MNSTFQLMTGSVGMRDLESLRRNIGGVDFSLRQLFGEGERNAAGSCANVRNTRLRHGAGERQYGFDHVFRFWTRNQHRWADDKVHAPEFLVASDVLCRDALYTLVESLIVAKLLVAT